jgi:mannose-6-phosphate isomerase class I
MNKIENISGDQRPTKMSLEDAKHFVRDGFDGYDYNGDGSFMLINVHGEHPLKEITNGQREYTVAYIKGYGEFTIDGQVNEIKKGDRFILPAGSKYGYTAKEMTLIEENAPGTESIKLDQQF